ncbi:unnamed protein product [Lymnaea stagnalis]|uniref:Aminoglycoside phosphotransferase domain-containing protein n=1 Tax=Lymnaea stagnalis TaxID=6523 RepID=A0AAV2ILL1_LYMST
METDKYSQRKIIEFISNHFNKNVAFVKFLTSYEDKVALVKDMSPLCSASMYILKIFLLKKKKEIFQERTSIVQSLEQKGFLCSSFLVGVNGNCIQEFDTGEEKHLCLLYTYLEGQEFENVADLNDPKTIFELGAFLGLLHKALEDVPHDALEPDPLDPWLLCNVHLLGNQEHLLNIMNVDLRLKLEKIINRAEKKLAALSGDLKKGVVHGDFHTLNIIVNEMMPSFLNRINCGHNKDKLSQGRPTHQGSVEFLLNCLREANTETCNLDVKKLLSRYGIIDFGEMIYTFQILEVGRIIADLMVTIVILNTKSNKQVREESNQATPDVKADTAEAQDLSEVRLGARELAGDGSCREVLNSSAQRNIGINFPNIMSVGGYILKGYHKTNGVSVQEMEVLKDSVMVSLAQYILLVGISTEDRAECFEYNVLCQKAAELLLIELSDVSPDTFYVAWADAALQC